MLAAPPTASRQTVLPPLDEGDRLTATEFERRYAAMPELKKAELLDGIVYMASPVSHVSHGRPHIHLGGWLSVYQAETPGVVPSDNATVRLGPDDEIQPDALLLPSEERGGRARLDPAGFIEGPPALVVEVASSSTSYDLHTKKPICEQYGVSEFVVCRTRDRAVDWFVLCSGRYEVLEADENGIYRSTVFPGLWLDPAALFAGDIAGVLAVLREGIASPEHAAFVAGGVQ